MVRDNDKELLLGLLILVPQAVSSAFALSDSGFDPRQERLVHGKGGSKLHHFSLGQHGC